MSQLGGIQRILCLKVLFPIIVCSITWRLVMGTLLIDEDLLRELRLKKICGFLKVFYGMKLMPFLDLNIPLPIFIFLMWRGLD